MAKRKQEKEEVNDSKSDDLFSELLKTAKANTLDTAGKCPYFIDTGNLALNYMCSGRFATGGIPGGRITEVFGPPATSKSLLGYCCLASCQRLNGIAVLLDCERAGNAEFAEKAAHLNTSRLITYEPISIEEVEKKIISATNAIRKHYGKDIPILFVWDSIGVSPTEREWSEIGLPENPTAAQLKAVGSERPGERARAAGDLLRKINPFINENNATLYIINQIRSKIGVLYGSPETNAGGGKSLEFYASCRLRTSIGKSIENKNGMPLGVNLKFKNKKSRNCPPGIGTEGVQLFFEHGINPLGGLLSILVACERVVLSSKGNFTVKPAFASSENYNFKASLTRNDVPLQVLLDNPKLIDLSTKEEVESYMLIHTNAVNLATGNTIVEKVVNENGDEEEVETPEFINELEE
mgnify:CR=1 FL=1